MIKINLFDLFVRIGVRDEASDKVSEITSKLGNGLKTAAKVGLAAVGAAATGIATLSGMAIKNFAEYEQLVGGVDTLFKGASKKLQGYAADAFKTVGMSANDYMSNVTSFSAALINALGGDTELAADKANTAMTIMADNANKMGTDLQVVVDTFQSLSRGNFAMLDNLKLGYGGTKAELERLLADAEVYKAAMGEIVDYDISNFADIIDAVGVIQDKLGITGATAQEAAGTISGSVAAMKASWQNLVTGIVADDLDFDKLVDDFVTSLDAVTDNMLPRIQKAISGAGKLIAKLAPKLIKQLPVIIKDNIPIIVEAITGVVLAISETAEELVPILIDLILTLAEVVVDNIDVFVAAGIDIIMALAQGLWDALPQILEMIPELCANIIDAVLVGFLGLSPEMSAVFSGAASEALDGAKDILLGIRAFLEGDMAEAVESGGTGLTKAFRGVLGIIDGLLGTSLQEWYDEVYDFFFDVGGKLYEMFNQGQIQETELRNNTSEALQNTRLAANEYMRQGYSAEEALEKAKKENLNTAEEVYAWDKWGNYDATGAYENIVASGQLYAPTSEMAEYRSQTQQPIEISVKMNNGVEVGRALINDINAARRVDGQSIFAY